MSYGHQFRVHVLKLCRFFCSQLLEGIVSPILTSYISAAHLHEGSITHCFGFRHPISQEPPKRSPQGTARALEDLLDDSDYLQSEAYLYLWAHTIPLFGVYPVCGFGICNDKVEYN